MITIVTAWKTGNDRLITMMPPIYVANCNDETLLNESMEEMLETITANHDRGYRIDIEIITQHIQDGMTLITFNLLVININRELSKQFGKYKGLHRFVLNNCSFRKH